MDEDGVRECVVDDMVDDRVEAATLREDELCKDNEGVGGGDGARRDLRNGKRNKEPRFELKIEDIVEGFCLGNLTNQYGV